MALRDRLPFISKKTTFANGTSRQKTQPKADDEIGAYNDSVMGFYGDEELRTDKLSIKDYVKMRQNDGTVNAMYNVLTLPILATNYSFAPAEEDNDLAQEIADFVTDNFTLPPHKGGMSTPFQLFLSDLLRSVLEGYRLFEKVWTISPDGYFVYKKLAPRDAQTITLRRDEHGGFNGATQKVMVKGEPKEYKLEVGRCFLFTFGKDKDLLYGESAFKPAHYHYTMKHKLYYLANRAVEVGAIPPRVLKTPQGASADDKKWAERQNKRFGLSTSLTLPAGYDFMFSSLQGRIDPVPLIDHHNAEMARSILAQFMMLGTSNSNVGSWALSKDQSDVFVMALKGLMDQIEQHINSYLIPDLVDYNFANTDLYPEFHFSDMTSGTREMIRQAFIEIVKKDTAPDWLIEGVAEKLADELDVEVPEQPEDDVVQDPDDVLPDDAVIIDPDDPDAVGGVVTDPALNPTGIPKGHSQKKKKGKFADGQWWRPLTPAEQRVNFADLDKKLDKFEEDFEAQVKPIYNKIRDDAVLRLTDLLEKKDYAALDSFQLNFADEYTEVAARIMGQAYNYAKLGASDELGVKAPATPKDTKAFLEQDAKAVVDKQLAELLFEIKSAVLSELRKNTLAAKQLGINDVLATIAGAFSAFFENKIALTGAIAVSQSVNRGRNDVFDTNRNEIAVYQYSAILDDATCPICEDLDGTVLEYAEYRSTKWEPPIHHNCRCIWIAILRDQTEIPDVTGLPDMPGGISDPILAETHIRMKPDAAEKERELARMREEQAKDKEKLAKLSARLAELDK